MSEFPISPMDSKHRRSRKHLLDWLGCPDFRESMFNEFHGIVWPNDPPTRRELVYDAVIDTGCGLFFD
jgi:hypothetical protein